MTIKRTAQGVDMRNTEGYSNPIAPTKPRPLVRDEESHPARDNPAT